MVVLDLVVDERETNLIGQSLRALATEQPEDVDIARLLPPGEVTLADFQPDPEVQVRVVGAPR